MTIDGKLCPSNGTLVEIYDDVKHVDGFIDVFYSATVVPLTTVAGLHPGHR